MLVERELRDLILDYLADLCDEDSEVMYETLSNDEVWDHVPVIEGGGWVGHNLYTVEQYELAWELAEDHMFEEVYG